ncbi:MAG: hypothetical protein HKP61_07700 [Dactylosporangium sp.]|nr:hypothetical protein [Dactylosporangium sp.]NNJ60820.1 hypothetical protein [Dactylosporangium sp.]
MIDESRVKNFRGLLVVVVIVNILMAISCWTSTAAPSWVVESLFVEPDNTVSLLFYRSAGKLLAAVVVVGSLLLIVGWLRKGIRIHWWYSILVVLGAAIGTWVSMLYSIDISYRSGITIRYSVLQGYPFATWTDHLSWAMASSMPTSVSSQSSWPDGLVVSCLVSSENVD